MRDKDETTKVMSNNERGGSAPMILCIVQLLLETTNTFSCGGFQVLTPACRWVFSLMCQHGVGNEGCWRPSSFSFAHIL
jgi:hypothetical protein